MMFDMLHKSEFNNEKGDTSLTKRLHTLRSWILNNLDNPMIRSKNDILRYTDQYLIRDEDHFKFWHEVECKDNWEGLMLRKDVGYEGKRTKNLLKVKKFHDAEYEVLGWDIDQHEVVRDGKSVSMTMLSQVWIEHKGYIVKVGSGFTQEQRLEYMDGSIVGKVITVQYFEETNNQEGGISLRFPTVKVIHGDKREV